LEAAAARARQRFASREAIGYLDAALALVARLPDGDERRRREIELRLSLGAALGDIHGFASEQVRENYERASDLCAGVGNAAQLFGVLYARWYLHGMRAQADETIALAAQIQNLARRLGASERVLAATVLVRTALYDARFADAVDFMPRRLTRRRQRKPSAAAVAYGADPLIVAASHTAAALWFLGEPERALATARAAVTQARECGDVFTLCAVLMQAAFVALACRNTAEGADLAEQAVSLSAAQGFAFWNALASVMRGWALIQRGQVGDGCADIEHALDAMQATGTRFFAAFAYGFLAEGRLRAGAPADGLATVNAGLTVAETTLNRPYEPELWRLKGELLLEQSKVESSKPALSQVEGSKGRRDKGDHKRPDAAGQAEACFQRALELARKSKAKSLELRAATSLARAWQARGRAADARRLLGGICKWFGARANTGDLVEARALLSALASAR
jgi:adenylate cyclase